MTHEITEGVATHYQYDAKDNQTAKQEGALTTYTYDVGNQLNTEQEPSQVITYSYDNKGNITVIDTGGSLATQTWDYENRVAVIETASELHTMAYDADGLRRQWDEADTVKKFIWDNQDVLLETDVDGLPVPVYDDRCGGRTHAWSEGKQHLAQGRSRS